jgi:SpoVK/Ycf46/Vps4 family AAA+-type ATPase
MDNYEGIVVLTTNLPAAMDPAFRRRMDASIDFQQPGPVDRQQILIAHLPAKHAISQTFLNDLVMRCVLSGGQIRNIVLHAALLAADKLIGEPDLQRAVEREYRKMGGVCPLPKMQGVK